MAARTLDLGMSTVERKPGIDSMVESDIEPVGFAMTVPALRTIDAVMGVILEVTANALGRCLDFESVSFVT